MQPYVPSFVMLNCSSNRVGSGESVGLSHLNPALGWLKEAVTTVTQCYRNSTWKLFKRFTMVYLQNHCNKCLSTHNHIEIMTWWRKCVLNMWFKVVKLYNTAIRLYYITQTKTTNWHFPTHRTKGFCF